MMNCNSLIYGFPLNDSVVDAAGGSAATLVNGAAYGAGVFSRGVVLDGINDYVDTNKVISSAQFQTFTISFWIKNLVNESVRNDIMGMFNEGADTSILIMANTTGTGASVEAGTTNFWLRDDLNNKLNIEFDTGTIDIYDGEWHLVTWVCNDSRAADTSVWIDAQHQFTVANDDGLGAPDDAEYDLWLGCLNNRDDDINHTACSMDEFMWFDRELSISEIQSLYSNFTPNG